MPIFFTSFVRSLHPIEKVVVVGTSGAVGTTIVQALCFQVSVLTRSSPNKSFPSSVKVIQTDYTQDSLLQAFHSQQAVVSVLAASSAGLQHAVVDAAIACGLRHFIPSEYGVDSESDAAIAVFPPLESKIAAINYLRAREDKITWTALIIGCLFDWCFDHPPFGGWSLENNKATVCDGGDTPFEATTMPQLGHAVVAVLRHQDLVTNQNVCVNSFTVTQNQIIKSFERAGNGQLAVTHARTDSTWQRGVEQVQKGGTECMQGVVKIITAAFYGHGGLNFYSTKHGLWNERLDLLRKTWIG